MPLIPDPDQLERLRQQFSLMQSELARLQREQQSFNTNSAIGYYGTGMAQMTEGAADIFLNVGGILYSGVHQKIQEYADIAKTAAGQLSAGDYSAVAIDQGIRIIEDKFREESLVLKTLINTADSDKSAAEKIIDASGDLGSYLEDQALESAASIVSGAKQMRDGVKTLNEGQEYRQQMNNAFEKRKADIKEKLNQLNNRIRETEHSPSSTSTGAPDFQPMLDRIRDLADQLLANVSR